MNCAVESTLCTPSALSLDSAMRFLWQEADMLDRLDYRNWLKLWTVDGLYIVPIERDATDHANVLNIAYDDDVMRAARVKRLKSGFSMASTPPARTVRTISRFVVTEDHADLLALRAAMMIVEYKYERTRMIVGDVDYRLVRVADGIRMASKIVRLLNSDDYLHGLGYLL